MFLLGLRESIGRSYGFLLGLFTGTISFFRRSRMFHPRGVIYLAEVSLDPASLLQLPPHALLRLSSAWWKKKEWVDVLGIAIRFSQSDLFTETALPTDQDLLFATIRHPWTMPFAPFATQFHDFLSNEYFAVTPFSFRKNKNDVFVKFSLHPIVKGPEAASRELRLEEAVQHGQARFELRMLDLHHREEGWQTIARIHLNRKIDLDQEALRFDPFRSGAGIHPRGFVHFLRIGAYLFSQRARPKHAQG